MQTGLESNFVGSYRKMQGCMHEISWQNKTPFSTDRFIRGWTQSRTAASKGLHELHQRWGTWQYNTQAYSVLQQKLITCEEMLQHNRERGIKKYAWARKIPPTLLCERGECHQRHKTTSHNTQEGYGDAVTWLQCIVLQIHQYDTILYKPGPKLCIADGISRKGHIVEKWQALNQAYTPSLQ